MQEMLMAIWHQNFDQLIQLGKVDLLIWCLVLILFLESAFVFLPLPGDSLVLMAGGLLAAGVLQQHMTVDSLSAALVRVLTQPQAYAAAVSGAEAFYAEHGGATAKHMAVLGPWLEST